MKSAGGWKMHMKSLAFSVALIVSLIVAPMKVWALHEREGEPVVLDASAEVWSESPQEIFDRAWRAIEERYYDPTFGGQDWSRWKHRYDGKLETADDAFEAIDTMQASLAPPCLNSFSIDSGTSCGVPVFPAGLGLKYSPNEEGAVVVAVFSNSSLAGDLRLIPGDTIVEVDGVSVAGFSSAKLQSKIMGKRDSAVSLAVLRNGERRLLRCVRNWNDSAYIGAAGLLDADNGYVNLMYLGYNTLERLSDAIKGLGGCRGLIIDLRNCRSDMFFESEAEKLANAFIAKGVLSRYTANDGEHVVNAKSHARFRMPVVILVNNETAGTAELFVSALQENQVATVVGETTKGEPRLYSEIHRLARSQEHERILHVKSREYLFADGRSLRLGITPDKVIPISKSDFAEGRGPWWYSQATFSQFSVSPDDKQLRGALKVLHRMTSQNFQRVSRQWSTVDILRAPERRKIFMRNRLLKSLMSEAPLYRF